MAQRSSISIPGKSPMNSARKTNQPQRLIQSSGGPTEPSKSKSHLFLILSKVGYLLTAAGPSKRICYGMVRMVHCALGACPGAAKYKL